MQMVQIIRATSVLWSKIWDVYQKLQVIILFPPTAYISATDFIASVLAWFNLAVLQGPLKKYFFSKKETISTASFSCLKKE